MDQYAVIGNPIAHSKSPLIHRLFAEQTGQNLSYSATLSSLDGFAHEVTEFFADGGKGLNITVPFKLEAWQVVDDCSEAASCARAVNTIKRLDNGDLYGTNTDGIGLCTDLETNLAWPITARRVLIIGAGGAVRGVLGPLLDKAPAMLTITNRSMDKAQQLCDEFSEFGEVSALRESQLKGKAFDLIINATSASISGELPPVPASVFGSDSHAYDMFYADSDTAFMRWAQRNGARATADGLGMLVEQAAESFSLWRGVRPETAAVIAAVRDALTQ